MNPSFTVDVRSLGAAGNGVTNDWDVIMRAFNNGRRTANAVSSSSGSTVTFGSVPIEVILYPDQYYAVNATTDPNVGVFVHLADATTVSLNGSLTVNVGDTIQFDRNFRGTIYFPPGDYYVSRPIDMHVPANLNVKANWLGEMGASILRGNFADYVLTFGVNDTGRSDGGLVVEGLTVINTHPTGGGIRLGYQEGAAIRNCDITANQGINTTNIDQLIGGGFYWGSFETTIENVNLSPGSNVSGSVGLIVPSDGPIMNCRIVGFETGALLFGGEGAMAMMGCYFEGNSVGIIPGQGPGNLGNSATSDVSITGCHFKNNGTAIQFGGCASGLIQGCRIEGTNGAAPSGTNPQYGIRLEASQAGNSLFRGIIVTGQFDHAGIHVAGGETQAANNIFEGVKSTNSGSGVAWHLPATAVSASFDNCNVAPVYTMSKLSATSLSVTAASYNSGTGLVTLTCAMGGNIGSFFDVGGGTWQISVTGVSPSGYNGSFTATPVAFNQITYSLASNPGSYVSGGSAYCVPVNDGGVPALFEGNAFNVSDSETNTFRGVAKTGGGATHGKVRWNGSGFTVMAV